VDKPRIGLGLALLAGLVAGGGARAQAPARATIVRAQAPGQPAAKRPGPPVPRFTRSASFRLPIQLDDRVRATLREIRFYVRRPGGEWVLQEAAPPSQTGFVFKAPSDGEYCFQFTLVDRDGRSSPAQLDKLPPALVVVVDTQAPEVEVLPARTAGGRSLVQCNLRDANPDYAATRLEYQTADGRWQSLPPLPGVEGVFPAPEGGLAGCKVRVAAADRAGNSVTRELTVVGPGQPGLVPAVVAQADPLPTEPARTVAAEKPPLTAEPTPSVIPALAMSPAPHEPAPEGGPTAEAPQLLGSTHCSLDYSLDPAAGPAGKVEVWMTRDRGRSWSCLGEDPDRRSPAELDLPGDGVYGLAVVVLGPGQAGGQPPAAGESPDWWVEVDVTRPTVQLTGVRAVEGSSALHITWSAADKNLADAPVELWYATQPSGPWRSIVSHYPNTGCYDWTPPPGVGPAVYLRVEATDRAGNVGRQDSPTAVALAAPRAKAKVLKVTANAAPRP
jgi:hypothetical protein